MSLKNVLKGVDWGVLRGGFRGGVRGVRPPPKIRKAYVIQR